MGQLHKSSESAQLYQCVTEFVLVSREYGNWI